jgi:endo-1,4-beta-xylanase
MLHGIGLYMLKRLASSLCALILAVCLGCSALPPSAADIQFPTDTPTAPPAPSATALPSPTKAQATKPAATFAPPVDKNTAYTQTAQAVLKNQKLTPTLTRTPWPADLPRLRDLAEKRGIYIGAAVQAGLLQEKQYADTLSSEFNLLTAEYEMKMCMIWPKREEFNFNAGDTIVQFAVDHKMRVRGHTLVWTECLPEWIEKGTFTQDEAKDLLHQYISTVVGRYKGKVQYWDVINESFERSPIWEKLIGKEYAQLAFQWAHEADPDALLFYNDYNAEGMNVKSDAIYAMVKGWKEAGVPIHGVGLQSHFKGPIDAEGIAQNIARLNDLGLQVHITELDFPYPDNNAKNSELTQAKIFSDLLKVCLQAANCPVFVLWGFTDKYTYLNGVGAFANPLIFDKLYLPKPSYAALYQVLSTEK